MQTSSNRIDLRRMRLHCMCSIAWALLLAGWVGLGSLAQTLATGPVPAFALIACWLLLLGGATELLVHVARRASTHRLLLPGAGMLVTLALTASLRGGGVSMVWVAMAAWALLVALASTTVRACRVAVVTQGHRPGAPVVPAAIGAALAWFCLGDITDLNALSGRLAAGASMASLLLAALWPRGVLQVVPAGRCHAASFDCAMLSWAREPWRDAQRRPLWLASFAMLPMMCSLPLMVGLCREGGLAPRAMVGLHFAAMFVPAVALKTFGGDHARGAPALCIGLLVIGAAALLWGPTAWSWSVLALAHGGAWSLAWAAGLKVPAAGTAAAAAARANGEVPPRKAAVLSGALPSAVLVMLLGAAVSAVGLQAFTALHLALGAVAALTALAALPRAALISRPRAP